MADPILTDIINPALSALEAYHIPVTDNARALLYAIGLQESGLTHRCQILSGCRRGPARGLWQFERGGGVAGVLKHKCTADAARFFADSRAGSCNSVRVWEALERDDFLACVFARLLLWTDPKPLPPLKTCADDEAWAYYKRNWRPGRPHPETWTANRAAALNAVEGGRQ